MSALAAMPLIIFNLGGEMVYVLRQRLIAQAIDPVKAKKVLNDVVGAIFNDDFVKELFKPHALYTTLAVKQIFQRLAHCSIMKLNETSMSKLYDLMVMVFKYQVLACRSPENIVDVTLRHITEMRSYVDSKVQDLLDKCTKKVETFYKAFSFGQFWSLRQTLFDFLQGRNVKVSLLLQENLQRKNGKMVLSLDGPCPRETPVPGRVRHFDAEAMVSNSYEFPEVKSVSVANPVDYDKVTYDEEHGRLGRNLYALCRGDQKQTMETQAEAKEEETETEPQDENEGKTTGADELNVLADLIVPSNAPGVTSSDGTFRLNLFASSNDSIFFTSSSTGAAKEYGSSRRECGASKEEEPCPISVDAKSERKSMQQRMRDLNFVETGASKEADGFDDLLDLMDEATTGDDDWHK